MLRDEYIKVILRHPYYSKKFNNSTKFIPFPSSFGICIGTNKKWMFYEIDEREKISKKFFNSEYEAFKFAFKKYSLKEPSKIYLQPKNTNEAIRKFANQILMAQKKSTSRIYPCHACRKKIRRNDSAVIIKRKCKSEEL